MNYQFNVPAKNLAGDQIKDETGKELTCGKILAGTLVNQSKGDAIKYFNWALKMYNCELINLDKSDVKVLTDFVEANEQMTVLAKAQILEILNKKESSNGK